jgi:hypothetical protein
VRGSGKVLVKPKKQAAVVLPAAVMTLLAALAGYILVSVTRFAGYNALQTAEADDRIVQVFLADTLIFLIVFGGIAASLLIGAVLWAWWVSLRIFGPLNRLERRLAEVLDGDQKPLSVGVRKNDMLHEVFDLMDRVLSRR